MPQWLFPIHIVLLFLLWFTNYLTGLKKTYRAVFKIFDFVAKFGGRICGKMVKTYSGMEGAVHSTWCEISFSLFSLIIFRARGCPCRSFYVSQRPTYMKKEGTDLVFTVINFNDNIFYLKKLTRIISVIKLEDKSKKRRACDWEISITI